MRSSCGGCLCLSPPPRSPVSVSHSHPRHHPHPQAHDESLQPLPSTPYCYYLTGPSSRAPFKVPFVIRSYSPRPFLHDLVASFVLDDSTCATNKESLRIRYHYLTSPALLHHPPRVEPVSRYFIRCLISVDVFTLLRPYLLSFLPC